MDDKRRLRAASRQLRTAASECVATLQALDAQLPPAAWAAFPCADGLRLQLASAQLCSASGNFRSNPTPAVLERCAQLLRDAPARLQRLHLAGLDDDMMIQSLVSWPKFDPELGVDEPEGYSAQELQRFFQLSRDSTHRLAGALAQSPAAPQLRELVVDWEVLASKLGGALAACPRLQRLRLKAAIFPWAEHPWSPALPQGLTSLELSGSWIGCLRIQSPALARLTALRHLALEHVHLVELPAGGPPLGRPDLYNSPLRQGSMGALGRLTSLQSLRLEYANEFGWAGVFSGALTELAPMTGLTSLVLAGTCSFKPAAWATLAQLPRLAQLEIAGVAAPPLAQAAPLAALTSLKAGSLYTPEGYPAGVLRATLPGLVHLDAQNGNMDAALLQDHPCLRRLRMAHYSFHYKLWMQQLLCTMPQLQEVCLEGYVRSLDGLLADLAACSGLRSIRVLWWDRAGDGSISAAGIRALAGAASSGTLESIVLGRQDEVEKWDEAKYSDVGRVALADALPLLQAPMPMLRELRVPVLRVGARALRALARQLGSRPLDVLRAQLGLDVEGAEAA
jgi:hypothetical protein